MTSALHVTHVSLLAALQCTRAINVKWGPSSLHCFWTGSWKWLAVSLFCQPSDVTPSELTSEISTTKMVVIIILTDLHWFRVRHSLCLSHSVPLFVLLHNQYFFFTCNSCLDAWSLELPLLPHCATFLLYGQCVDRNTHLHHHKTVTGCHNIRSILPISTL